MSIIQQILIKISYQMWKVPINLLEFNSEIIVVVLLFIISQLNCILFWVNEYSYCFDACVNVTLEELKLEPYKENCLNACGLEDWRSGIWKKKKKYHNNTPSLRFMKHCTINKNFFSLFASIFRSINRETL